MKMKNFKINSENITNIAARIVVAVGIIVLVVVAFKLAAFLLTKILFPLLGGVIQILFEELAGLSRCSSSAAPRLSRRLITQLVESTRRRRTKTNNSTAFVRHGSSA